MVRLLEQHLLRSPKDAECRRRALDLRRPYVDSVLRGDPKQYADFLGGLFRRGLIDFAAEGTALSRLGVFFVAKKNGSLRIILDTRECNTFFVDPPRTRLPRAGAFSALEAPGCGRLALVQAAIENAFYGMQVPDRLSDFFGLPKIRLDWPRGLELVAGHLPGCVGRERARRWAPARAHRPGQPRVAPLGGSQGLPRRRLRRQLRGALSGPATGCPHHRGDPVGLEAQGPSSSSGRDRRYLVRKEVSLKSSRLFRLKDGLEQLVSGGWCDGPTLQSILGHCTWAALLRRESVAFFRYSYAFIEVAGIRQRKLWPSVSRDLRQFAAVLPLLRSRLAAPWSSRLLASDTSPCGVGVCEKEASTSTCMAIGKVNERWRFRCEESVAARAHALGSGMALDASRLDPDMGEPSLDSCQPSLVSPRSNPAAAPLGAPRRRRPREDLSPAPDEAPRHARAGVFSQSRRLADLPEVPPSELRSADWQVVWSMPWLHSENSLRTEGRALVWSVRHALRRTAGVGQRHVCLVDNLPLARGGEGPKEIGTARPAAPTDHSPPANICIYVYMYICVYKYMYICP